MASLRVLVVLQLFAWCYGMEFPRGERMGKDVENCEEDKYIVGGRNTTITEFPFVISLEYKGAHTCGGSIISDKFVLTAAHCVKNRGGAENFKVRVGSSYRQKEGVLHSVKRAVPHEDYRQFDFDVAVVELEKPIKFNENASAIEISKETPMPSDVVTVIGYGEVNVSGELPQILQTVDLTVMENDFCYTFAPYFSQRLFCTHAEDKSPFNGDGGTPSIFRGKLVGSVAFWSKCVGRSPTLYLKLMHPDIRDFIRRESGVEF